MQQCNTKLAIAYIRMLARVRRMRRVCLSAFRVTESTIRKARETST